MKPSEFIEGVPRISMDLDAHYAQPRYWGDRITLGRRLTDAAIARYERQGRYGRAQLKAPGGAPLGKLVWST